MNRICILMPYFGKFPDWFQFWLKSCEMNPDVSWLFYTDCEIPKYGPQNVGFLQGNLASFNSLATEKLGMEINLQKPYKVCDLRPAFGNIFEDWLKDYDFWGYGDLDLIYGNIRKFCNDQVLQEYDIISGRKKYLTGHFALYRNNETVNNLYKNHRWHQHIFQHPAHKAFDEKHMTSVVRYQAPGIRALFENFAGSDGNWCIKKWHKENGWEVKLDNGELINLQSKDEYMYFHFFNMKKGDMEVPQVDIVPNTFSITEKGLKI